MMQNPMEQSSVRKAVIYMSLPPMASMFLQFLYFVVDSIFVARLGEVPLVGVSTIFPLQTLMTAMAIFVGVGANVLIANALGHGDKELARKVAGVSLSWSVLFSVLWAVLAKPITGAYLSFIGAPADVAAYGMEYFVILGYFAFGTMVHINIQKIFQGKGNMLLPMVMQMVGAVANIILDPILIFGWGKIPAMGVKGAALATLIGQQLSTWMAIAFLLFMDTELRPKAREFGFDWKVAKPMFVTGMPSFALNIFPVMMLSFINGLLLPVSVTAVAVYGIYYRIQGLGLMTVNGIIQGTLPLMSYDYGGQRLERLKQTRDFAIRFGLVIMAVLFVALWIWPDEILYLFKGDATMIQMGREAFRWISLSYGFMVYHLMMGTFFQAVKKSSWSLWLHAFRQVILFMPVAYGAFKLWGVTGVWISFVITEGLMMPVTFVLNRKATAQLRPEV